MAKALSCRTTQRPIALPKAPGTLHIYIYIYIYVGVCVCICIYIYIYMWFIGLVFTLKPQRRSYKFLHVGTFGPQ